MNKYHFACLMPGNAVDMRKSYGRNMEIEQRLFSR